MLTKAEIKKLVDLHTSKGRAEQQSFICEGIKLVADMLGAFPCTLLITDEYSWGELQGRIRSIPKEFRPQRVELVDKSFDFKKVSTMKTPQPVLSVFEMSHDVQSGIAEPKGNLSILLDDVQDPGNVGTIIRTADWFGVRDVYLTKGCADPYSSKVIQATMGALGRVRVHRLPSILDFFNNYSGIVLGAFLDGESVYELSVDRNQQYLLVFGNEGNGIGYEISMQVDKRIVIPSLAQDGTGAESLNVAIAAAICTSELAKALG